MKFVVNGECGGFGINSKWLAEHGFEFPWNVERNNPELIAAVENGENVNDDYSALQVVEVPDNCTDYEFTDYDGYEDIIYVVNGKLHHAQF